MYNKNKSKLSSKLTNYESPIQLEGEWDRLEKRLNKEKRRRLLVIVLPLLLLLSSTAFYINYLYHHTSKLKATIVKKNAAQFENKTLVPIIKSDQHFHSSNKLSKINTNEGNSDLASNQNSLFNANKQNKIEHINASENTVNYNRPSAINENHTNEAAQQQNLSSLDKNNTDYKESEKEIFTTGNKALMLPYQTNPSIDGIETIAPISTLSFVDKRQEHMLPAFIMPQVLNKQRNNFWIDAAIAVGKPITTYTDLLPEAHQLVNLKKKAERPLENIQWDLFLGKHIIQDFYIKAGLQLVMANELLKTSIMDTTSAQLTNIVTGTYTNLEGIKQDNFGTLKKVTITEKEITKYSNIQTLSIVVLLGKNFTLGKTRWSAEAGAGIPVWHSYSGMTLAGSNTLLNKNKVYTSNRNWSMMASIRHQYPIRKSLLLTGGYTFTKNKLSTNLGYSQITDVHSVSVGLRYFIN
jgi:hypothetical protein